jgi:hypothetical protein
MLRTSGRLKVGLPEEGRKFQRAELGVWRHAVSPAPAFGYG